MHDTLRPIALADCAHRATLMPHTGGALVTFQTQDATGRWFDLLDTRPHPSRSGAFALGCNILAPFSNRIAGGGFHHDGRFHALSPNIEGEPYPNHGNAFSSAWRVIEATAASATLALASEGPGPFRYAAELRYALGDGGLEAELKLTNTGPSPLPFGGGFHPWFPRTQGSTLRFSAAGVWSETADHLPDQFHALDAVPDLDHRSGSPLRDGFTNVAYAGWDGFAELAWPEAGIGLTMTASPPLAVLMLYSPGREAPFISLEPVSHTVDAHNRFGDGVVAPTVLAPGESLVLAMRLAPYLLPTQPHHASP